MRVYFTHRAEKDLRKIGFAGRTKTQRGIKKLQSNSLSGKKLKGELNDRYAIKIWPYRIIYRLKQKNLEVLRILHRQGAYK
jgi:mRNA interferase RelE/StbE